MHVDSQSFSRSATRLRGRKPSHKLGHTRISPVQVEDAPSTPSSRLVPMYDQLCGVIVTSSRHGQLSRNHGRS